MGDLERPPKSAPTHPALVVVGWVVFLVFALAFASLVVGL